MLTDLSPLYHNGVALIRPEDSQIKKGSWIRGSPLWPSDSNKGGWFSGKYFVVSKDTILVDYPVSRNIVNQDYAVIDLTNQTNPTIPGIPHPTPGQQGTFQMYPATESILYQISVGMKKGPYFVELLIPSGAVPIYQMGSSSIPPSIIDPVYRYLGARYPKDSPVDSPTWFLYSILNAPQIVLNVLMDGGDTEAAGVLYGKATIVFRVNKCFLKQINLGDIATLNNPVPSRTPKFTIPGGQVSVATGGPGSDTKVTGPQQQAYIVDSNHSLIVPSGWALETGSGSAILTTMEDVRKWQNITDKALYIPFYTELTGY